ncbi:thioredoxin family protein [Alteribacillus sp. HJP-4]|uniref:thioredoxin family protein n=1 Tax=Alteribacillus sp. HJP-4 TaxID=2775394 RepID=UPI0035CCE20A
MEEITSESWSNKVLQEPAAACFIYSPLCGTCGLAERMLLPMEILYSDISYYKLNINYIPELIKSEKITSVPCLKLFSYGEVKRTIYAFTSVPLLSEEIERFYKLIN